MQTNSNLQANIEQVRPAPDNYKNNIYIYIYVYIYQLCMPLYENVKLEFIQKDIH